MTVSLKHKFESEVADGDDDSLIRPSNWNDEHDLTMATGRILGRTTEDAGAVEELTASDVRTFLNVEDGADATDATNVAAAGAFMKAADDSDDITEGSTKLLMTTGEREKVGHLTVTQAVDLDAMESKLAGIEAGADVTDATNVASAGAVMASLFDANTILAANTDNTPAAVTVAEARFVGRSTGGNIAALDASASRTIIGLATGDSPQFEGIELSHATENTLTAASGVLSIEGAPLAFRDIAPVTLTGTSETAALAHAGKIVEMNNGSSNTYTIPANSSVAFPVGSVINIVQYGAGVTTIDGDTGVTVNGVSGGGAAIAARYEGVAIYKRGTDEWVMSGSHGSVA